MFSHVKAIVGCKEDIRVLKLSGGLQRRDEAGEHLIYGLQRLQSLAIEVLHLRDLALCQEGSVANEAGFVADVRFVK
jgi:Ran GTPase-activating protein (RanGAP) involved in mRNA processing and transport